MMAIFVAFVLLLLANVYANAEEATSECPSNSSPNVLYYNTRNTTEGSVFEKNLKVVYKVVLAHAPSAGSFEFSHGKDPDKVYGFAACFQGDCEHCLISIKDDFRRVAHLAVGARMCLDSGSERCYLRYENYSF